MKFPNGTALEYALYSESPVGFRVEVLTVSEKECVRVAFVKSYSRKMTSSGLEISLAKLVTFKALLVEIGSFWLLKMSVAVWSVMAM